MNGFKLAVDLVASGSAASVQFPEQHASRSSDHPTV